MTRFLYIMSQYRRADCYALPLTEDQSSISSHFGEAFSFMLVIFDKGSKTTKRIDIVKNPFNKTEKGKEF